MVRRNMSLGIVITIVVVLSVSLFFGSRPPHDERLNGISSEADRPIVSDSYRPIFPDPYHSIVPEADHSILPEAGAARLPLDVREFFKSWEKVGDGKFGANYLKIDQDFIDPDEHCEFCTRVEYTPGPQGMVGFSWKGPKGVDFQDAKKISFYARGETGMEAIKFNAAGQNLYGKISSGVFKNQDFAVTTTDVILSNDWKKYEIDLSGSDLTKITYPFGFELTKDKNRDKVVFYLKDIIYDAQVSENPFPTSKQP